MYRVLVFLCIILIYGCNSKTPAFEIYQEASFIIPSGRDPLATHHFIIHKIQNFLPSNLNSHGLKSSDLSQFYAGKGKFGSIGSDYNFGIIYDVSIWIYKENDYANRKEIYYLDEVPFSSNGELKLLSTGEDLREILTNDTYEMDIELRFKSLTGIEGDCKLEYNLSAFVE